MSCGVPAERSCFSPNNSREAGDELLAKLTRLGVLATPEEMLSAAEVTGPFHPERFGPSRVLAIGSERLRRSPRRGGPRPGAARRHAEAQVVAIGHDFGFDYQKAHRPRARVRRGAAFVAVNLDPRLPVEAGSSSRAAGRWSRRWRRRRASDPRSSGSPRRTSSGWPSPGSVSRPRTPPWSATASTRRARGAGGRAADDLDRPARGGLRGHPSRHHHPSLRRAHRKL